MRNNRIDDNDPEFPEDFFPGTGDEGDGDDDEENNENFQMMQDQANIEAEMDLNHAFLKKKLLFKAIKIREREWFWSFRSHESKLMRINMTYRVLLSVLDQDLSQPIE